MSEAVPNPAAPNAKVPPPPGIPKVPRLVSSSEIQTKGIGRNQQISVASIVAVFLGVVAFVLGIFPATNTYSLLPAGLALVLTARATLYAWADTVLARGLPMIALLFSLGVFGFCFAWPYYGDAVLYGASALIRPPESNPSVSTDVPQPDASAVVPEAERRAAQEIQQAIKKQMENEKSDPAVKPPRPPE